MWTLERHACDYPLGRERLALAGAPGGLPVSIRDGRDVPFSIAEGSK